MNKQIVNLGTLLSRISYNVIPYIGNKYRRYQNFKSEFIQSNNKQDLIFNRIYKLVDYSINNIPFYNNYYKEKGFDISCLKTFDDISKIPIVTKNTLQSVDLGQRSAKRCFSYIANTGGSTGVPLSFYKTFDLKIKELVYFHESWSKLGYKKHELKLHFVGRGCEKEMEYALANNEIRVSIYMPFGTVLSDLASSGVGSLIKFIHGYPSVLYEFALYCEAHLDEYRNSGLTFALKGVFLNSEYPYPYFRENIEKAFNAPTLSWYGHSEVCALAFNSGSDYYNVLQSYGYAEAVEFDDGLHLIATSYDNFSSPFIRYDTNDIMDEVIYRDGLLDQFLMVNGGRNGQYVIDNSGKKISVTGLVFGKHHKLFDFCSQIQISQPRDGYIKVYYVPISEIPDLVENLFDLSGIDICAEFCKIDKPIKSRSGKTLLLIKD